ncbi:hypothetical protein [Actinomyces capricornis]|uniref:Uncharacterized protein n=1 Tax=Actinomyces capricornis TaxID=2755559 RepID=A0ABN6K903_9ACTO|nr:hypothetical protein [Actinomyces capricornis]BDA64811.1 hypothetical protein MANAM107_16450 [Actinomyces capricornis]
MIRTTIRTGRTTERAEGGGAARRCALPLGGRRRRLLAAVSAAALATGTLGACSFLGGGSEESADGGSQQASNAPAAVTSVLESTRASAGSTEPVPISTELPVLASRETSQNGRSLTMTLNSVTVSGGVTTVLFSVTNMGSEGSDHWQVGSNLADDISGVPLNAEGAVSNTPVRDDNADGVTIIDTANSQVYRAAYDTGGSCLCSSGLSGVFVDPGQTVVFQTSFAALPEDVSTVTVTIPLAGSFDNVSVTR